MAKASKVAVVALRVAKMVTLLCSGPSGALTGLGSRFRSSEAGEQLPVNSDTVAVAWGMRHAGSLVLKRP